VANFLGHPVYPDPLNDSQDKALQSSICEVLRKRWRCYWVGVKSGWQTENSHREISKCWLL